jgi:hypothetical protein
MPTNSAPDVPWRPGGGRGKLKAMDKTTYPPNRFPPTTPDVDASVEASLWQPPSATSGATSTAAQQWEVQSTGKRILPAVVIGVAVAALIVGMNYQFKHNDHDTTLAQGQASESIINEAPPAATAPDEAATPTAPSAETAPAVAPPPEPAPVVTPRAETAKPAPAPRPAPATVAPRAPAVPPADTGMRAPLPEPTPTPAPAPAPNPTPTPSPQPLSDTSPQPPLPVPAPTPAPQPQPTPEPINSN